MELWHDDEAAALSGAVFHCRTAHLTFTGNPPYSILPYSSVARVVQLLPLGKRADSPEVSPRRGRGQKHQTKLADLDFVVVGQHGRVHGFAVDVRAIEAAGVDEAEFAVFTPELGVAADYLRQAERIGPYLTLLRGRMFEEDNIRWGEAVLKILAERSSQLAAKSSG